ncbi:MAG: hypothetical protein HOO04_02575 [Phycisphaerae bacterium]|nr:hypothetical protein [Phycisphaerae bacterium]MBT5657814.1 hypothetical protein [Phycisphaerae bacterium]
MVILNLVIIAIIALIAYWWANQGFLSGLLHLICVVTAAAIALAWWEPIVVENLLSKSWWSGLMPGTMLLITFVACVAILRAVSDKVALGNTQLPRPLDMTGGAIMGVASGIVTTGILLIGVGFIDQPQAILGYTGWHRPGAATAAGAPVYGIGEMAPPDKALWLPVDAWTVSFYEALSLGSLHPDLGGRPLADWNPRLDRQAGLLRDRKSTQNNTSFGQMIQPPGSIDVGDPLLTTDPGDGSTVLMVPLHFESAGMDFGNRLALGASQVRIVGTQNGTTEVLYPSYWAQFFKLDYDKEKRRLKAEVRKKTLEQEEMDAELIKYQALLDSYPDGKAPGLYQFANSTSYITEPDERKLDVRLLYTVPDGFETRFIQIRGTRFDLKPATAEEDWDQFCIRANIPNQGEDRVDPWGGDISGMVTMRGRLPRGSRPSLSDLKGDVEIFEETGRIIRANAVKYPNKSRGSGKLGIKGYAVLTDDPITDKLTYDKERGIIKIAVGPTTRANILAVSRYIGGDGAIVLYDTEGGQYAPRGFELKDPNNTTLTFNTALRNWSDITNRPRFGSQDTFSLIFVLPVGVSLDRLELGDEVVGLFENIVVEPPSTR